MISHQSHLCAHKTTQSIYSTDKARYPAYDKMKAGSKDMRLKIENLLFETRTFYWLYNYKSCPLIFSSNDGIQQLYRTFDASHFRNKLNGELEFGFRNQARDLNRRYFAVRHVQDPDWRGTRYSLSIKSLLEKQLNQLLVEDVRDNAFVELAKINLKMFRVTNDIKYFWRFLVAKANSPTFWQVHIENCDRSSLWGWQWNRWTEIKLGLKSFRI